MELRRRELISGASAAGLASALAAGAARGMVTQSLPGDLYRVDDPTIMAAAREIIKEDHIGVLVTIDEQGMPRARPVGLASPKDDWSLWGPHQQRATSLSFAIRPDFRSSQHVLRRGRR